MERLVAFLAEARSFPTFQETLDAGLALLRLSDALAGRCGLKRNTPGGGDSASNIALPRWRDVKPASAALVFTHAELQELDLSVKSLEPFIFNDDHLKLLANERLWNSSLERHPLFQIEDGILIAEPSSLVRAIAACALGKRGCDASAGAGDGRLDSHRSPRTSRRTRETKRAAGPSETRLVRIAQLIAMVAQLF